jgi:NAD(P)-dependent dehydrogenase (short-subunit alcohol dehydrogenase family)
MADLAGRSVVITGAGAGIGRAAAQRFARAGAHVTVVDRDGVAAARTVGEIEAEGGTARPAVADVSRDAEVHDMLDEVVRETGGLDVLVNNAGVQYAGDVVDCTEEQWDRLMAVNAKGCFLGAKHAIPHMVARGGGAIVNNASLAGVKGGAGLVAYSASKGAVVAFSKALAAELAGHQIRVNTVCPGWTDTEFNGPSIAEMGGQEGLERFVAGQVPLGRLAAPEEIAAAMLFLGSDESSYMTGQVLVVDGGIY